MSAEPPERAAPASLGGEAGRPARRARPVADLPLDALLARSGEAARRLAIALIAYSPLDAIAEIPLQRLAADAPALCEQLLRALCSDAALDSLLAAPAARLDELVCAPRPALLAELVETLRGVTWELLLEALPAAGRDVSAARLVGDLSDRLAQSCAALLAAALEQAAEAAPPHRLGVEPAERSPLVSASEAGAHEARRATPAPPGAPAGERAAGEPPIVIVDERRAAYASIERPPFRARVAAEGVSAARQPGGFVPLDASAAATAEAERAAQAQPGAEVASSAEISVRDERGEGPEAWVGSIGRELQRHEHDGEPFAVLLLEARAGAGSGADPDASGAAHGQLEDALAAELREVGGSLTRERAGRWWALAPRTDRFGAEALGTRLQQVSDALTRRSGVAAKVSIGVAICPEDGSQASTLAAHADVGLYAARTDSAGGRPGGSAR